MSAVNRLLAIVLTGILASVGASFGAAVSAHQSRLLTLAAASDLLIP